MAMKCTDEVVPLIVYLSLLSSRDNVDRGEDAHYNTV